MKVRRFWNERWSTVETPFPTNKCKYMISDLGRIMSIDKESEDEKLLNGTYNHNNLKLINIKLANKKYFKVYIHRFIAINFVDKPSDEHNFVVHKNEDRTHNNYKNLKWLTKKELIAIQKAKGQFSIANQPSKKNVVMTKSKVRLLKARLRKGKTKRKILAKQFGISQMQVSRILSGKNWGHVE